MPRRLALPEAGSGPGLVLFAEADRDAQEIADLYAAEGYVVLCPEAKIEEVDVGEVTAAAAGLRGHDECTGKVGALGFGRGSRLAYLAAAQAGVANTGIDCAVVYHARRDRSRTRSRPAHPLSARHALCRERPGAPGGSGHAGQGRF